MNRRPPVLALVGAAVLSVLFSLALLEICLLYTSVDKRREIHFLGNVKIHLDEVDGLGTFVEIEAIDDDGTRPLDALRAQCEELMAAFGIRDGDLLAVSYSDLLRRKED